ncbi:hypothetical protein TNCV_1080741 [Trichonephila clavipes]|uniref:Uncharacterized protein n=1 Tax=Trichonephila clavipes TaxID=2585209 RepID=A0A8X6RSD8_TRICX|nr:hypothetical protein TNCV_1080741 [Trichonephila clavipes]
MCNCLSGTLRNSKAIGDETLNFEQWSSGKAANYPDFQKPTKVRASNPLKPSVHGHEYETDVSPSLDYADKLQTLDHLEDNIRRVIADIRPQMFEKVIENWTSRLDYIRASRGSHMPEIIFKM